MTVFDHTELLIVKGVAKALGDTTSDEAGLVSINLLTEQGMSGWALDIEKQWNPLRAVLKGGGVWADSAITPGRTMVGGADTNVIEVMQLVLTGDTLIDLATHIRKIGQMIEDCHQFWWSFNQIEPIFLRWHALGAPGPQFALIHNIEMAIVEPDVWQNPIRDVTLTIERESYWRARASGDNPKVWSFLWNNADYTVSNLNLDTASAAGSDLFGDTAVGNNDTAENNFVEIDGTDIPGDAPALLQICARLDSTATPNDYWIAVKTEPFTYSNVIRPDYVSTLDASAATLGTDAASAADTTCASGNRVNITPGTATDSIRLTFPVEPPAYRGRFALFMRAYQNGGSAGDWLSHIEVQADTGLGTFPVSIELSEVQFSVGATHWPMVYYGQIELPVGSRAPINVQGGGIDRGPYIVQVYARRTTGTSTLRFADLVVMPLDEGFIHAQLGFDTAKGADLVYDNTGYFLHGQPGSYLAPHIVGGTGAIHGTATWEGPDLYLTPGKKNRIYFIRNLVDTTGGVPTATFSVRGNIIPRWRGIRDV